MKLPYRIISGFIAASSVIAVRSSTALAQAAQAGADAARGSGQPADIFGDGGVFGDFVDLLLFIIGAVAVIMIIYGGFRYVTSGGNAANVTAAKNTVLYAIVGIIVALLAYAAVDFVIGNISAGGTTGL